MKIFDIDEQAFLNPEKVKIIDGIAGAGKSSAIDKFFKDRNIKYLRTTSTNALKRDAERRYSIDCDTIAGGLFITDNGKFFSEEKDPSQKVIVIDEILQTSIKVIDWIRSHRGEYNIIVTTDTRQMLTQESGDEFLITFLEYSRTDEVIYKCLTETKRARTEETKELYNFLYDEVTRETRAFEEIKDKFPQIKFEDLKYNPRDVFICHTKEIEDYLYKIWKLADAYDMPLIPKGTIARKPPGDLCRYPILSQIKAEARKESRAYLQIANVVTPTRYQGSEVTEEQHLYYIIERHSVILNRETYTVITRCYNHKSITIVYINLPKKDDIKTFFDKPVKRFEYAKITTDHPEDFMPDPEHDIFKNQQLVEGLERVDGIAWNPDGIIINGEWHANYIKEESEGPRPRFTARSLIQKESYFDFSYMPTVYKIMEKHGIEHFNYPYTQENTGRRDDYPYYIDLHAAYVHILKMEKLPIDGKIYEEESPDKLNFYKYTGKSLTPDCIITDTLAEIIPEDERVYLFSTDYRIGSKMGDYLYEKAYKSIEDKAETKTMHYGYWQKPFLQKVVVSGGCYIREDEQNHELMMTAICSKLLRIMLDLRTVTPGFIQVDALHFTDISTKWDLVRFMREYYPEYDFRIAKKMGKDRNGKEKKEVLYQTYPELLSRKQRKSKNQNEKNKQKRKER